MAITVTDRNPDAIAPKAPRAGAQPKKPQRKRVPFHQLGGRRNLHIDEGFVKMMEESGYHLSWANDDRDYIRSHLDAGCDFVKESEYPEWFTVGDPDVGAGSTSLDSRISRVVDRQSGMRAYLMKKPMEYHEEDMAILAEMASQGEKASAKGAFDEGGQSQQIENAYTPRGGGTRIQRVVG